MIANIGSNGVMPEREGERQLRTNCFIEGRRSRRVVCPCWLCHILWTVLPHRSEEQLSKPMSTVFTGPCRQPYLRPMSMEAPPSPPREKAGGLQMYRLVALHFA